MERSTNGDKKRVRADGQTSAANADDAGKNFCKRDIVYGINENGDDLPRRRQLVLVLFAQHKGRRISREILKY